MFDPEFQSHAGSIEAPGEAGGVHPRHPVFQSHAGSIEAARLRSGEWTEISCFNPTLVRLRLQIATARAARRCQVSIPCWFD